METDTLKARIDDSIERNIRMLAAQSDYSSYFQLANPEAVLYPHTQLILDKVQKIVDGEQHYYIVEMPPQHGKSTAITETLPSYYLMRHPDKRVMVVTYSQSLYIRAANKNRRHYQDLGNIFGLHLGKSTSDEFNVAGHNGEAYFTSILGGGTGRPADLLIIDDPVKDAQAAHSPTIKQSVWDEWAATFSTRLQKGSSVIVIMTRWQTDDLAGRLLDSKTYPWEEIKLPAIAHDIPKGKTDEIGRHNGDPLCEQMHPLKDLLAQKKNLGTHVFTALYQQSPTIEGGNIFKRDWIKYYVPDRATMIKLNLTEKDVQILPRHLQDTIQTWDATFKSKENDDFVAGQTWSRRNAELYLRPGWCHKRLSFTETLTAIKNMKRMYPRTSAILVEDKANGPAILDTLRREIAGIMPVSPGADSKEARAASVSPRFEAGQIYVPHPLWIPAVEDMIEEWIGFPNMPHDDSVDAMVYAVRRLHNHPNNQVRSFKF